MRNRVLTGQAAIVTGGSRGIGKAIARALVAEGVNVAICARDGAGAASAAAELTTRGPGRAIGSACDVADYQAAAAFVARATGEFGRLDVLVNNAGVGVFASVTDMDPADFRHVIDTNLVGVFNFCHAAIPAMRATGGGFIVNISSLAGKNAFSGGAAYNASKFGLNGFSEALMQDVRYDGIRVSYVMPGSVATEFGGGPSDAGADWKLHAEDIAEVVIDLVKSDPRALSSRVEMRPSRPKKEPAR
jgi:NAD(P)-dependent dehydrogenase (short-subunit alcohol dehydrogenase family)